MFEGNITLRDVIIEYLKDSSESISSLHRKLKERGYDFHRLILTGYLKALADMGEVQEKEIKPAKVYSIKPHRNRNIYEKVGEEVSKIVASPERQTRLGIYVLQKLFHRPVFLEEVKRCNLEVDKVRAEKADSEKRAKARNVFSDSLLNLPFNDPAYVINEEVEELEKMRLEVMQNIILSSFSVGSLAVKSHQITLGTS